MAAVLAAARVPAALARGPQRPSSHARRSQRAPAQPGLHVQEPSRALHEPPCEHAHWPAHPTPNVPSGHVSKHYQTEIRF
ncbi:unnamed protein product [Leptidea sinapis]|uniref:Uncharacterized protein n=1 Tax=Leptidea sinapis TaxID=189913 RepID=A0A5E4R769_9NEOP|nr:unnamed protein product [Leptidea sinapis]